MSALAFTRLWMRLYLGMCEYNVLSEYAWPVRRRKIVNRILFFFFFSFLSLMKVLWRTFHCGSQLYNEFVSQQIVFFIHLRWHFTFVLWTKQINNKKKSSKNVRIVSAIFFVGIKFGTLRWAHVKFFLFVCFIILHSVKRVRDERTD